MLALPTAWVWLLLAWFAASDTRLLEHISVSRQSGENKLKTANGQGSTRKTPFSLYARIAAYFSIAVLFWSFSLSPNDQQEAAQFSKAKQAFSFSIQSSSAPSDKPTRAPVQTELEIEIHDDPIHNETLGFQKIFVINLPERTDKRDALSLASVLTDIKLTWTTAIRGSNVPDKALPLGVERKTWRDGGIGSWRSQMNVIRT